ncbi:Cathepsin B-like cysteine proteinase 6 [Trichinella zimbabwensis]|uniref:Cathepsin B-like cysteine proteinase 6 n=1 Tax=Trichinella zimbabwensis TaxID=268475 RepID=A0A0V1HC10_9BILA|nr:Cathepsin B-like cysteine proteinase 6 [Trichinella zimbabwensis]
MRPGLVNHCHLSLSFSFSLYPLFKGAEIWPIVVVIFPKCLTRLPCFYSTVSGIPFGSRNRRLYFNKMVTYINNLQTTWKAGRNAYFETVPLHVIQGMMGVRRSSKLETNSIPLPVISYDHIDMEIPAEFDSRKQWPYCPTIGEIRDQSNCGSCWAFGAVEAISDRICIATDGRQKPHISSTDLLSCCKICGFGCQGGDPHQAWSFWVKYGLVTGGNYTTHDGCRPYPFAPCNHHSNGTLGPCSHDLEPTPICKRACQSTYKIQYSKDKYYGLKAYSLHSKESDLQKELMMNGPMEVAFQVYEDFLLYKTGVYQHHTGSALGGHAVRLLGWGEENGVPYWLLANSWNSEWGDEGFFKIYRGRDECGIESEAVAGLYKKPTLTSLCSVDCFKSRRNRSDIAALIEFMNDFMVHHFFTGCTLCSVRSACSMVSGGTAGTSFMKTVKRAMRLNSTEANRPANMTNSGLRHAHSEKSLRNRIKIGGETVKQVAAALMMQRQRSHSGSATATVQRPFQQTGQKQTNQVTLNSLERDLKICLRFLQDAVLKRNLSLLAGSTSAVLDVMLKLMVESRITATDVQVLYEKIYHQLGELFQQIDRILIANEINDNDHMAVVGLTEHLMDTVELLHQPNRLRSGVDCADCGAELKREPILRTEDRNSCDSSLTDSLDLSTDVTSAMNQIVQEDLLLNGETKDLVPPPRKHRQARRQETINPPPPKPPYSSALANASVARQTRQPRHLHPTNPTVRLKPASGDSGIFSFCNGSDTSLPETSDLSQSVYCNQSGAENDDADSFDAIIRNLQSLNASLLPCPSACEPLVVQKETRCDDECDGDEVVTETRVGDTIVKTTKIRKKKVWKSTIVKHCETVLPLNSETFNASSSILENFISNPALDSTRNVRLTESQIVRTEEEQHFEPRTKLASFPVDLDALMQDEQSEAHCQLIGDTVKHCSVQSFKMNTSKKAVFQKTLINGNVTEELSAERYSTQLQASSLNKTYCNDQLQSSSGKAFAKENTSLSVSGKGSSFAEVSFRNANKSSTTANDGCDQRKRSAVSSYMQIFGNSQPSSAADFRSSALVSYERMRDRWHVNVSKSKQATIEFRLTSAHEDHCAHFDQANSSYENWLDIFENDQNVDYKNLCAFLFAKKQPKQLQIENANRKAIANVNYLYELDVRDHLFMKDGNDDCNIRGGLVDVLVAHAASACNSQNGFLYREAFLTTYRSYILPFDLLKKLVERYNHLSTQRASDEQTKSAKSCFSLIVRVVDELSHVEATSELLKFLVQFIHRLIVDGELLLARLLRQKFVEKYDEKLLAQQPNSCRPLFCRDPDQATKSHSIFHFKASLSEILQWSIDQAEEKCPHLTEFTNHFNKMSYWVRSQILLLADQRQREHCFVKFLKIMRHLRRLGNLNSCLALLSALDSGALRRLDWPRSAVDQLNQYSSLIDSSQSFKVYRTALAETKPPCLPYLGLILQDLTFVEVGNADYLPVEEVCVANVVNFAKRWQQQYNIKKNDNVLVFFNNFDDYANEEQIWAISERLKPRNMSTNTFYIDRSTEKKELFKRICCEHVVYMRVA